MGCKPRWLPFGDRRILLVRHGNTGKAASDADRRITPKGELQASAFKAAYAAQLSSVVFAFCSPVERTATTARLLGFDATPVPDLYFGNIISDEHRTVDRALGYAPLQAYLRSHSALYSQPAERMAAGLSAAGSSISGQGDALVVGHAMYLSLLTLEIIRGLTGSTLTAELAAAGTEVVMRANVGEVEGFEISSEGVRYLRNPESEQSSATRNDDFITT